LACFIGPRTQGSEHEIDAIGFARALSKDVLISSSVKHRSFFGVLQHSSSLLLSNVRICFAVFSKTLALPGSPEEFLPKPGETWGKRW